MAQINSYLTFNGNCRQAMMFYKDCLGGDLNFQTVGDSPLTNKIPAPMKDYILQATLTNGALLIMASDMVGERGLIKGTAISLMLICSSEEEINKCYAKLAKGGTPAHPLEISFWGALFGDLTDKFGNQWLLHFDKNKN